MSPEPIDFAAGAAMRTAGGTARPGWSRRRRATVVRHVVINLFLLIILLPLVWVLLMSVKTLPDAMRGDFLPSQLDFSHYPYVFERIATLPTNLFNSIYVTFSAVLITMFCAVTAGYALVHLRPRGSGKVIALLLVSLYFPVRVVSLISIYETQRWLGLINDTAGLILPYVTLQLAISVLIMRSMFQLVPHEIIDAARVDGAGPWRTLWMVGLPMVRNGLVVIFIVNFVAAWGEYLLCVTLVDDQARRTMPVVLAVAQGGQGQWAWPNLAAAEGFMASPEGEQLRVMLQSDLAGLKRASDGGQELFVIERLHEELDRAGLHGLDCDRNVAVAGQEDDRHLIAVRYDAPLKLETAQIGKTEVQDHATRDCGMRMFQELARGSERLCPPAGHPDEFGKRFSDRHVVVDDEDGRGAVGIRRRRSVRDDGGRRRATNHIRSKKSMAFRKIDASWRDASALYKADFREWTAGELCGLWMMRM
jgi:ABC-type glycerol-3-phosphate transport system permease component